MANASPSSTSTTTATPSSAWSRLVQLTRTASEGSRNKATKSSSPLNRTLSADIHSSSSAPPSKKRRQVESPPARSVTKYLAPLSPEPNDPHNMSPRKSTKQKSCSHNSSHDCITACPCRVEDVDCVASQETGDDTRRCSPRSGRRLPTTAEDSNKHPTPTKTRKGLRRGPSKRVLNSPPRPDEFETKRHETLTHFGQQTTSREPGDGTEIAGEIPCGFASLKDQDTVAKIVSEPEQPAEEPSLSATGPGLHEGDQNSVNKTPIPKRHSPSPASTDESIQLVTPSSSPATKTDSKANEAPLDATEPHKSAPPQKNKRRLTLHGGSYERQASHKKHKTASKRKDGVQTTLSLAIGSSAGMRECKLCDTVYNPFHPEDVKVHTKRHAIAVKRERRSEEVSGHKGSSLVD